MLRFAIALALAIGVIATAASAKMTKEDVDTVRAKMQNVEQATATKDVVDVDVDSINVRINTKAENGRVDAVVGILPTDAEFAAVLAAVKAVAARRAAEENAAIDAIVTPPVK